MTTPALVFDLDGTLVDTAPDLLAALNTALEAEGRPPVDPGDLRRLVGRGARVLISEAFKMVVGPANPDAQARMLACFLAYYEEHVADRSRPFPGVVETLTALNAQGVRLGVLTNKPHEMSIRLLEALGLSPLFRAIYGQGRKTYLKPDPRLFADVVHDLGGPGRGAVMIGDSITDVETARGAGAPVILVSYGYTPEPAHSLGADAVVDAFGDIPAAVAKLLQRP
ncbi:MAG: HAD-IA family hydrolase [Alphaproteobacteria bacterium]|nr:HAD-IA family hydrolase [Alphaproteobacteria bacterium]